MQSNTNVIDTHLAFIQDALLYAVAEASEANWEKKKQAQSGLDKWSHQLRTIITDDRDHCVSRIQISEIKSNNTILEINHYLPGYEGYKEFQARNKGREHIPDAYPMPYGETPDPMPSHLDGLPAILAEITEIALKFKQEPDDLLVSQFNQKYQDKMITLSYEKRDFDEIVLTARYKTPQQERILLEVNDMLHMLPPGFQLKPIVMPQLANNTNGFWNKITPIAVGIGLGAAVSEMITRLTN